MTEREAIRESRSALPPQVRSALVAALADALVAAWRRDQVEDRTEQGSASEKGTYSKLAQLTVGCE